MERNFNTEDFEKLLRHKANEYRMYPSEKVWEGVHAALHTRRKWYGISALLLLFFIGTGISFLLLNKKDSDKKEIVAATKTNTAESISQNSTFKLSGAPGILHIEGGNTKVLQNQFTIIPLNTSSEAVLSAQHETPEILPEVEGVKAEVITIAVAQIEEKNIQAQSDAGNSAEAAIIAKENITDNNFNTGTEEVITTAEETINEKTTEEKLSDKISAVESLSAILPAKKKQPRLTAQFYFTPTVSYRTLKENKRYLSTGLYTTYTTVDLNDEVKHKPAIGLEFGVEGKYKINDQFSFKTGFQFNINRYDIKAFSHPTEIATVTINNGYGTDLRASFSNYRNKEGVNVNWLENFYFQAAIPIGGQFILTQKKKYSWGVSGTIQPTYGIGERAYLISSDYKNYAKFPDLMRRWNISTGLETFIAYSTGKINWQAGPHLRYQHLSSFISGYPVRENLFAVGFKVAASFSKNK